MSHETEDISTYPQAPKIEPVTVRAEVIHKGQHLADSKQAFRVLQKGIAPTIYFPPSDILCLANLKQSQSTSHCPWKGDATYWDLEMEGDTLKDIAWSYETPLADFESLKGFLSFYPAKVDQCKLDNQLIKSHIMPLHGGWVSDSIKVK